VVPLLAPFLGSRVPSTLASSASLEPSSAPSSAPRRRLKVLDVGCGSSSVGPALAAAFPGCDVCGVDAIPAAVEVKTACMYNHVV